MTKELWLPIKGYEGLYEVSDQGRVKSLWHGREKILKPQKDTWGYPHVILCKDGKKKILKVHRLVAEAFIPNPNNLETVNHKDEVKSNNAASNLEWMSQKDNNNFGSRTIRAAKANINNPALSNQVQMFDNKTNELLATFPSISEAERVTGINRSSISHCCTGRSKSSGGYIWRYL